MNNPLFTIITLAYRRFDLTRQSLEAMMGQTYKNLEIIVVNNGATPEITEYLIKAKAADDRIKIIHFNENQFSYYDPLVFVRVCFNAALKEATGDYVFYQSDDDLMSSDYAEKIVKLFEDNPNCTSAAGLIKCIDGTGKLLDEGPRVSNYRPRYMPGHLLVLNRLCEGDYNAGIMFSAPGCIFTLKREELIKAGGYHMAVESSQLYGIVPFGITGFDETAVFYWRRHQEQTNKTHGPTIGFIGTMENVSLIKDWEIEQRWQVFGKDVAHHVVQRILKSIYEGAVFWFVVNLYHFRFKACWWILKDAGNSFYFWRKIPLVLWTERRQFWYYLKPKISRIFEKHPWLIQKVPLLVPLQKRVLR